VILRVLYHAYVLTDDKEPFRFELKEIPVKSITENGEIETEYPCFYGLIKSTTCLNGSSELKTDKEYSSGNSYVYFSTSYENCMVFLVKKRQEMFEKYKDMLHKASELFVKLSKSGIKTDVKNEDNKYSLWMEGFSVTGNSSIAQYLGEFEGNSFNDACDNWSKTIARPDLYEPGTDERRPSYWGCKIFDNEMDARKSFG